MEVKGLGHLDPPVSSTSKKSSGSGVYLPLSDEGLFVTGISRIHLVNKKV